MKVMSPLCAVRGEMICTQVNRRSLGYTVGCTNCLWFCPIHACRAHACCDAKLLGTRYCYLCFKVSCGGCIRSIDCASRDCSSLICVDHEDILRDWRNPSGRNYYCPNHVFGKCSCGKEMVGTTPGVCIVCGDCVCDRCETVCKKLDIEHADRLSNFSSYKIHCCMCYRKCNSTGKDKTKNYCVAHLAKCCICEITCSFKEGIFLDLEFICFEDLPTLPRCQICNKPKLTDSCCTENQIVLLDEKDCQGCSKSNQVCSRDSCITTFCDDHSRSCSCCNEIYCSSHRKYLRSCSSCKDLVCQDHYATCTCCKTRLCSKHQDGHSYFEEMKSGERREYFLLDSQVRGEYIGMYNRDIRNGWGVSHSPLGISFLQEYKNGDLILNYPLPKEEATQLQVEKSMLEWEKEKESLSTNFQNELEKERKQMLFQIENQREANYHYKTSLEELIQEGKHELEIERLELENEIKMMKEKATPISARVQLLVGGKKFTTSVSTLTLYPESFFGTMFNGRHQIDLDDEGYIFIDRNGDLFEHILDFLRDGEIYVDDTMIKKRLSKEADFFGLLEMMEYLETK